MIVYVTDDPIDDAVLTSAMEKITDPVIIDASRAQNCFEVARTIARQPERNVVISNLLESFYDTSIPTREAARVLGYVKSTLEGLENSGHQVVVLCHRRAGDLGTRSHFIASLCASADQVRYFRSLMS